MYNEDLKSKVQSEIIAMAIKRAKGKRTCTFLPAALNKTLKNSLDCPQTDLNLVLRELVTEEFLIAKTANNPFQLIGKVSVKVPHEELPIHERIWLSCLNQDFVTDNDRLALIGIGSKLGNFDKERQTKLLDGLYRLRDAQKDYRGVPLYDVSAKFLLGSSKMLSGLKKEAVNFGIRYDSFTASYRYITVASPQNPKGVILVENPHSFETAVQADTHQDYAWVCSYGFGIALDKGYKYGELLLANLTKHLDKCVLLTRSGNPPDLKTLLSNQNISFWGDLDTGGLSIFLKLKSSIPNLKPSKLNKYLIAALAKGIYHPYTKLVGKAGQVSFNSSDQDVTELMILCGEKGVDQELVSIEQVQEAIETNNI